MLKKRLSDSWALAAFIILMFLTAAPAAAQEVVLHLKNGDRLSGRLVSENTNAITLTNVFLGTLRVPLNEINRREVLPAPASPPPSTNVTMTVPAGTNAPAAAAPAGTNVVKAAPPPEIKKKEPKPPLSPANPEATPIASTPSAWKHDIRFGLNMRYADKDSQEFLTIAKSTYGKQPFRHIFDVNFKYGQVEGVLSANSLTGSEKTEYQLSPKAYVFGLVGGGYDKIRRIDGQFELGPGMGMELLKKTNFVWKSELGLNYQRQYRDDDTRLDAFSARIAEIFAWRVWQNLTADLKLEFYPNFLEFGEYRFRLESTLRYPVSKRLSLNLDIIDIYDSQPAQNVKPNDLQIRSTIGVTF